MWSVVVMLLVFNLFITIHWNHVIGVTAVCPSDNHSYIYLFVTTISGDECYRYYFKTLYVWLLSSCVVSDNWQCNLKRLWVNWVVHFHIFIFTMLHAIYLCVIDIVLRWLYYSWALCWAVWTNLSWLCIAHYDSYVVITLTVVCLWSLLLTGFRLC